MDFKKIQFISYELLLVIKNPMLLLCRLFMGRRTDLAKTNNYLGLAPTQYAIIALHPLLYHAPDPLPYLTLALVVKRYRVGFALLFVFGLTLHVF